MKWILLRVAFVLAVPASLLAFTGCSDDSGGNGVSDTASTTGDAGADAAVNEVEVITTVQLTFAPGSGSPVVATFDDPDGDGGNAPTVDAITLQASTSYTLTVKLTNKLANPAEDITEEVEEEGAEHQLFFTGTAVQGPATGTNSSAVFTQAYGDQDENGAPVGLQNSVTTLQAGSGQLTVTLQHLPPLGSNAVKTNSLASTVASSGLGGLPGDADVSVTFDVTVQ